MILYGQGCTEDNEVKLYLYLFIYLFCGLGTVDTFCNGHGDWDGYWA